MKILGLYTKYAWRSIQRGGQRSFFAVLCVAVGVGAIVALQTTGLNIQDTVAGDARANARADVLVQSRQRFFSNEDIAKLDTLKRNNTLVDFTASNSSNGLQVKKSNGVISNPFGSYYQSFIVDPAKYPFYGKIEFEAPKGKTLNEVLTRPGQIVLNKKMADSIGARVGDKIKAESDIKTVELEVVGILNNSTPSPGDGQAEFTGYNYINTETARTVFPAENIWPQDVYVKTTSTAEADLKARDAITALGPTFQARTSAERNDQLRQATNGLKNLLSYVGLISLLIGSIGVVNTMLVVVGRRSTEIATIKALGMESGQTVQVFMIEAAILGVIGSLVGVVLGELLSVVMSQVAEGFVSQQLPFKLFLQPVLMGLIVGIVTAVVFGLLPAYSASKIPPAQVLRQKTNALPRISFPATLAIIVVMTLVMGTLAGIILNGQFVLGLVLALGTLVSCSLLVLVFSGILWLVGKLPLPFGLNYKMARRNLSRGRARSATTMLVMMVGIFSVALVIILASSLKDTLKTTLENSFGYNLQYTARDVSQAGRITQALESRQVPGLDKYVETSQVNVRLVSGGGASAEELLARKIKQDEEAAKNGRQNQDQDMTTGLEFSFLLGISAKDLPSLSKVIEGSAFQGDNQMMIDKSLRDAFGLKVGDQMIYSSLGSGEQIVLTITGVYEAKNLVVSLGPAAISNSRLQTIPGAISSYNINVERGKLEQAKSYLQNTFGNEATDLSFISNIFNKLIDQFTAFPVLLALLSLIAGAVLIANNVALAVLERRTEMGVMKSIGADSSRVLSIINLETNIVALLGGLLGLGLASGLAGVLIGAFGTQDNPAVLSISPTISIGMLVLSVGLAVLATVGSAWGAAHEKPLVVLRYE